MSEDAPFEVAVQEAADRTADSIRQALALLWLSEWRGGPRMNINVCCHGLGLGEGGTPEWLIEAIKEITEKPDRFHRKEPV